MDKQEHKKKMTNEECEINISALLDGELEPEELLPTLDHLSVNKECREFYIEARELQQRFGIVRRNRTVRQCRAQAFRMRFLADDALIVTPQAFFLNAALQLCKQASVL